MAVLDPSRTSVELSYEELRAAMALLEDRDGESNGADAGASRAGLEAAGVLRDGAILPYVAKLLLVVAESALRMVVERYVAERVLVEQVWAVEHLAVWAAEVHGDAIELRPVEPAVLPWEIVRAVGLGPRPPAAVKTPLRAPVTTFERLDELLAGGDREAMESLLTQTTELDDAQRTALFGLMFDRRSSWRASSTWTDESGPRQATVSVTDGATSGLWLSTHEQDGAEPAICLQPVSPGAVFDRLVELLPLGEEPDD